jgi:hypothetical protein
VKASVNDAAAYTVKVRDALDVPAQALKSRDKMPRRGIAQKNLFIAGIRKQKTESSGRIFYPNFTPYPTSLISLAMIV